MKDIHTRGAIDCADCTWKSRLEGRLRAGIEVTLIHFDWQHELKFCDSLAIGHSMRLNLDSLDQVTFLKAEDAGTKMDRAADAKEVGVGNPAEETFRYPIHQNLSHVSG